MPATESAPPLVRNEQARRWLARLQEIYAGRAADPGRPLAAREAMLVRVLSFLLARYAGAPEFVPSPLEVLTLDDAAARLDPRDGRAIRRGRELRPVLRSIAEANAPVRAKWAALNGPPTARPFVPAQPHPAAGGGVRFRPPVTPDPLPVLAPGAPVKDFPEPPPPPAVPGPPPMPAVRGDSPVPIIGTGVFAWGAPPAAARDGIVCTLEEHLLCPRASAERIAADVTAHAETFVPTPSAAAALAVARDFGYMGLRAQAFGPLGGRRVPVLPAAGACCVAPNDVAGVLLDVPEAPPAALARLPDVCAAFSCPLHPYALACLAKGRPVFHAVTSATDVHRLVEAVTALGVWARAHGVPPRARPAEAAQASDSSTG